MRLVLIALLNLVKLCFIGVTYSDSFSFSAFSLYDVL